jgi:hypothetical protein
MHNSHTALSFFVIVGVVIYSGDQSEGSRTSPSWNCELLAFQPASKEFSMIPKERVHDKKTERADWNSVLISQDVEELRSKKQRFRSLITKKQRFRSLIRIRGGMEGGGNEDNVGWGNVDMNAADDELDLDPGAQGAEQAWPEQVRRSINLLYILF